MNIISSFFKFLLDISLEQMENLDKLKEDYNQEITKYELMKSDFSGCCELKERKEKIKQIKEKIKVILMNAL
jgi:hypothetical protein